MHCINLTAIHHLIPHLLASSRCLFFFFLKKNTNCRLQTLFPTWCSLLCSQLKIVWKMLHKSWVWLESRTWGWYLLQLFDQAKQVYLHRQFPFPDHELGGGRRPWMEKAVRCPGGPSKHPLRTFTSEGLSVQRQEVRTHLGGALSQAGRYTSWQV